MMKKLAMVVRVNLSTVVLFVCLSIVMGVWSYGSAHDLSQRDMIATKTDYAIRDLRGELNHYEDYLLSIAGFYASSDVVDHDELENYAKYIHEDSQTGVSQVFGLLELTGENVNIVDRVSTDIANDRWLEFVDTLDGYDLVEDKRYFFNETGNFFLLISKIGDEERFKNNRVFIMGSLDRLKNHINEVTEEKGSWTLELQDGPVIASSGMIDASKTVEVIGEISLESNTKMFLKVKDRKVVSESWNLMLGVGVLSSFFLYVVTYALSFAQNEAKGLAEQMTVDLMKYKHALDSSANHVIITDPDGKIIYANESAQKLTGYSWEEMEGNTPRLWGRQMPKRFYEEMWETIKDKRQVFRGEITNKRKDGSTYEANATISPIVDEKDEQRLLGFVGVEYDITETKRSNEQIAKMNNLMVGRELRMAELKKELSELKNE